MWCCFLILLPEYRIHFIHFCFIWAWNNDNKITKHEKQKSIWKSTKKTNKTNIQHHSQDAQDAVHLHQAFLTFFFLLYFRLSYFIMCFTVASYLSAFSALPKDQKKFKSQELPSHSQHKKLGTIRKVSELLAKLSEASINFPEQRFNLRCFGNLENSTNEGINFCRQHF